MRNKGEEGVPVCLAEQMREVEEERERGMGVEGYGGVTRLTHNT